uniref:C-type lectin domain-containing protein n=1 Tax=Lepisosteus oculatus TaxID=7918 RepID=W5MJJ6_LEPOC
MKAVLVLLVCVATVCALDVWQHCSARFPQACPIQKYKDWYSVGSLCVKYYNTALNYSDAEFACRKEVPGGHLVSVHSNQSNTDLLCVVMKYNNTNPRIWLGAFELFRTGLFVWTDGTDWNYWNWVPGQPDNTANAEDCVEMNWSDTGKWNDDRCFYKKNYICAFKNRA